MYLPFDKVKEEHFKEEWHSAIREHYSNFGCHYCKANSLQVAVEWVVNVIFYNDQDFMELFVFFSYFWPNVL
jgi:hypothetical protein